MDEKIIQTEYNVSGKSRILRFYESNKKFIYFSLSFVVIFIISIGGYLNFKEKNRILLSENYIQAKVFIEIGEKEKAREVLEKIIKSNDSTYSLLSLYLMQKQNLILNDQELSDLYQYLLKEIKFSKEEKDLLIFKKALVDSSLVNEDELMKSLSPLISSDSVWKPHALLFIGDYFFVKNEFFKAKEFYLKILNLKNLNDEIYSEAQSQLSLIAND
jgi:FimV-like protein